MQRQQYYDDVTLRFTHSCRLAKEIPGSNYQFEWVEPVGTDFEKLSFNIRTNHMRFRDRGLSTRYVDGAYEPTPLSGEHRGVLQNPTYSLFFHATPFGSIQGGSNKQFAVATLMSGGNKLGTYLCNKNILTEF